MKILYFSDPHLSVKGPEGRIDIYSVATIKKLKEIGSIIRIEQSKGEEVVVVIGGDLFHTPKTSLKYAGQIATIIEAWNTIVYVIPGNHDLYGYNIATIDQTMLGMFANTGVVKLITRNNPIELWRNFSINTYCIGIEGQEYYGDIDKGNPDDYAIGVQADLNILVTHSMLLPKAFHPDVPCTLIKDVVCDADIVLAGHYHNGWDHENTNGTLYANPGSLLRLDASLHNKTNRPKVMMFDIYENATQDGLTYGFSYIELKCAADGKDIFDYKAKQISRNSSNMLSQFKQSVNQTKALISANTIPDMITEIAMLANIDMSIINKALNCIIDNQIALEDFSADLKGFVAKPYKLFLSSVTLHNFQSYRGTTTINFTEGLNAIIGESNMGKTSIMRAILWCLHNEPKGADFITTGEKSCYVTVKFSDNSSIKRERTAKSAGTYSVTNSAGVVKEFAGFSNNIPIEVMNEHQMPKVTLAKDLSLYLNVASQLDGPFLIKESPLNKASIVGRLIGTQVIDSSIKTINSEILNYNKEIKSLDKFIAEYTKDLNQYDDLSDIQIYMSIYGTMIDTYTAREETTNKVKDLGDSLFRFRNQTEAMQAFVAELSDKDKLIPKIEEAIVLGDSIHDLICFDNDLSNCRRYIEQETNKLETLPDEETTLKRITNAEKLILETENLINLREQRLKIFFDKKKETEKLPVYNLEITEELYQYVLDNIETCNVLINLSNDLSNVTSEISEKKLYQISQNTAEEYAKKSISDLEEETSQFLKASGTCMLCGSALTEDHIKHLVEGV